MTRLAWRGIALIALLLPAAGALGTTYYVRVDGGDAQQCSGKVDAPHASATSNRDCAWNGPFVALPASAKPRIAGGDTLLIGAGEYMIGLDAPGAEGERCSADWPWDCSLAAVPGGPSPERPTRILGRGHDRGCSAPPRLWGTQRVTKVLNLEGSANVEIGCLEITDKSDCVEFHVDPLVRCERDKSPYGQWASHGISAARSRKVWLHDLNIHGLANAGVFAGGLTDWTVERVRIYGNGWVGWNGDIGEASANAGRIVMRHVTIAWNGCGQRWKTGEIHGCWGQEEGGYGDGIGTASTGGEWIIEDSDVHHNTSDGIDLLYLDGSPGASITVRRSLVAANAGNQIKTRGTALIENSVVIGQCAYFSGRYDMSDGDQCRALGNTLSIALSKGKTATVRGNTIIGEGDCLILGSGGDSTARLDVQGNALIGQPDWRDSAQGDPELTCGYYADQSRAVARFVGNAFWNVKNDQCPEGGNVCGKNPKLTDMSMSSFNPVPLQGSPLISRGVVTMGIRPDDARRLRSDAGKRAIRAVSGQATR